jgi:hypothetical protein
MFIALALLLAIMWVFGFTVMKVSSVAIHVLIVLALASLAFHFFRGARSSA